MRVVDQGIYRKGKDRQFRRRYFIACEGLTEIEYLRGIKGHRNDPRVRIPNDIDIQLLERYEQDIGLSNPKHVLSLMGEYRELIRSGRYSVRMFAATVVQDLFTSMESSSVGNLYGMYRRLYHLEKDLISKLSASDLCEGGYVKDDGWYDATELCKDVISASEFKGYERHVYVPRERKLESYDDDLDRFVLIADRDCQSNPSKQYEELIKQCSESDVRLCISNPCFEFWLFLHHGECLTIDIDEDRMLANLKEEGRTYMESVLEQMYGSYSKVGIQFEERFLPHINSAVENAESFSTDLNELEDHLGSTVGMLIRDLRGSEESSYREEDGN